MTKAKPKADLSRSHYDGQRKSCPSCSRKAGRLVFHPIDEYGRRIDKGVDRIQPWCTPCRSIKEPTM